jgi:hypothetical protein
MYTRNKILYKKGYKYQLVEGLSSLVNIYPVKTIISEYIILSTFGELYLKRGYAWDGASGAIDTPSFMRGSAVHDALYQLMRLGLLDADKYRKIADKELRNMCKEDGMGIFRAAYVYKAVRLLGSKHVKPSSKKLTFTAP